MLISGWLVRGVHKIEKKIFAFLDKLEYFVKIQPNSVVDQARDCLNDGCQDDEHSGAGNVRAAKADE